MTTSMTTSTTSVEQTVPSTDARPRVPWVTVIVLAVGLAYADGFWVTSLRGAVGAVGRGQGPFTTWWHQSTVLVPLYACAVLGALVLALRWSHRGPGRAGSVLTGLLVTAAGTLVAVAVMAAGAAFDYHVQTDELQMMATMRGDCRADCLERLRHDTLWLQVRALGLGAGLLLVTNLSLVTWVSMLFGGRLDAARRRGRRAPRGTPVRAVVELQRLLATSLLGAAAIHAVVIPEHLQEWPAAGLFFVALTAVQGGAAVAVLSRPRRAVLLVAAASTVSPVVLWACSRAWGLPVGPDPWVPEPLGVPDGATALLEVLAVVLAVVLLGHAPTTGRRAVPAHLGRLALTAVLAVTAIGVAATQEGWFDLVQSPAATATMASR